MTGTLWRGPTEAPALRQVRAEKDLLQYRCLDVTIMLRNQPCWVKFYAVCRSDVSVCARRGRVR